MGLTVRQWFIVGIFTTVVLWFTVSTLNSGSDCPTCSRDETRSRSPLIEKAVPDSNILEPFQSICRSPEADRQRELEAVMDGFTGPTVSATDIGLINRIRKHFIDLPRPYVTKFSMPIVETPQAKEVNKILKHKVSKPWLTIFIFVYVKFWICLSYFTCISSVMIHHCKFIPIYLYISNIRSLYICYC